MIDLHCHTTCSDGKFSPLEMLKKAQEQKLNYFSITDHDEVSAYKELEKINVKDYFSGKLIYGSEIRFVYNKIQMEVLCYNYNFEKIKDNYWVNKASYHNLKKQLLKSLLENGKKMGFIYEDIKYNEKVKPERAFYNELIKNEHNNKILKKYKVKHSGEFFRKLISNPKSKLFFDSTMFSLSFEEAVDLVHENGGIAVLAHPFGVYNLKNPKKVLKELIGKNKLDGLECMHENITEKQTKYLLGLCKKYNLVSTGGSDYHGHDTQCFARANFGKNKIPNSLIANFLKKIN